MSLTYPLDLPTSIGMSHIEIRAVNSIALSQSPFSFKQQVISHGGQRWEATVTLPPVRRDLIGPWKALLIGLKGQQGTFLLGDPDFETPTGGATSIEVTGTIGEDDVTFNLAGGNLNPGDYFQVGADSSTRLYQVLTTVTAGGQTSGTVWPNLRATYAQETGSVSSPKGVFRLASNVNSWSINNASAYGMTFEAIEVIT